MKRRGSQFSGKQPDPSFAIETPGYSDAPQQLPMFMKVSELEDSITTTADTIGGHSTPNEVLGIKSLKSQMSTGHGGGVYNSIKQEGVKNPVQLIHTDSDIMMGDGHHRVGASIDQRKSGDVATREDGTSHDPDRYVPVIHTNRSDMVYQGGYSVEDRKEAIADAHNYRNSNDQHWLQHQQFKANQRGEDW